MVRTQLYIDEDLRAPSKACPNQLSITVLATTTLAVCLVGGCRASPPAERPPIIDVHLHAYPALPVDSDPIWDAVPQNLGLGRPMGPEEHRDQILEQMDREGIVKAVLSGPAAPSVESWLEAYPSRFIGGAWLSFGDATSPSVEALRSAVDRGTYALLGELMLQHQGLAFDDPRLDPYYALAAERGLPVAFHSSGGPPGTPYFHSPAFRIDLGNPLHLEPVLLEYPELRVYLMHAGHPFLEATKAILQIYPQVYVDTGAISWVIPRAEFHAYLQSLVEAGFGDRVMFGSDPIFWPQAITIAVQSIEEAPFLSEAQKRAIFHDNAARFLGMTTGEQPRD